MAIVTKTSCDTFKLITLPTRTYSNKFAPLGKLSESQRRIGSRWTDGTNIYSSYGYNELDFGPSNCHYVLNGDTWEETSWNGISSFQGYNVWTDGTNIYYSYGTYDSSYWTGDDGTYGQYVLNGDTWEDKTWNGVNPSSGLCIWTDGTNIYYSDYIYTDSYHYVHYVLNGDTWEEKAWNGLTSFDGSGVWSDGTSIYYSDGSTHYVLNGDTWEEKAWYMTDGSTGFHGGNVWTDGTNIYCSIGSNKYVLNGVSWEIKNWNIDNVGGIWTDGKNIYTIINATGDEYSRTEQSQVLLPSTTAVYIKSDDGWSKLLDVESDNSNESEDSTQSPLPIEISTEAGMTALLSVSEVGSVYKYTGTSGTYENGAFYVVEAVSE